MAILFSFFAFFSVLNMSGGAGISTPYLGSKINLVSKSGIRYEGYLFSIDTKESTVTLKNVQSHGTESRDAPKFISPRKEIYEYIVFRGKDIKDLTVSEGPAPPDDPAIISSGRGNAPVAGPSYSQYPPNSGGYPPTSRYNAFSGLPPYGSYPMGFQPPQSFPDQQMMHPGSGMPPGPMIPPRIPTPPVQSLSRSLTPSPETVMPIAPPKPSDSKTSETQTKVTSQSGTQTAQQRRKPSNRPSSRRSSEDKGSQVNHEHKRSGATEVVDNEGSRKQAPGEQDQRPRQGGSRRPHGKRGGGNFSGRGSRQGAPIKFEGDFDFESSNARFKKEEIEEELHNKLNISEGDEKGSVASADTKSLPEATSPSVYYDKGKSFFDSISCEANDRDKNRRAHPSWVEERKMNVETFGVAGGWRHGRGRGRGGRGGRGGYRGRGGGGRGGHGRGGWRGGGRGGWRGRGGHHNQGWVDYSAVNNADGATRNTNNASASNGPSGQPVPPSVKA